MRRGLETGLRLGYCGTPRGNGEQQIGLTFGTPRQSSTLPGTDAALRGLRRRLVRDPDEVRFLADRKPFLRSGSRPELSAGLAEPHRPAGTRAVARAAGDCRLFPGAGRGAGVGPYVQRGGRSAGLGPLRRAESLLVGPVVLATARRAWPDAAAE